MIEWHHGLDRQECEHTLGDGEGQGGLERCSPWGHKESNMTEGLNNGFLGAWELHARFSKFWAYFFCQKLEKENNIT